VPLALISSLGTTVTVANWVSDHRQCPGRRCRRPAGAAGAAGAVCGGSCSLLRAAALVAQAPPDRARRLHDDGGIRLCKNVCDAVQR